MFFTPSWENAIQKNDKKLKELAHEFESLNRSIESFLSEWGANEETISKYNQLKSEFSAEAWEILNRERLRLEAQTKNEISHVRNPLEYEKRYKERQAAPHWLFVR